MNTITINFENPAHWAVMSLIFLLVSGASRFIGENTNTKLDDIFTFVWWVAAGAFVVNMLCVIFNSL